MSYDNLSNLCNIGLENKVIIIIKKSSVSQNILKFEQQFTHEERVEGSLSFLMIFTFIVPELGALYFIQCHGNILVMYDGTW